MSDADRFEGRRLGRYRLLRRLARGGMAAVYLARMEAAHGFQRTVAVKVIHPSFASDRHLVAMFLDEAHLASLIHHTNVCSVLDFGVEDGTPYIVMEHLDGASLGELVRAAPGGDGLEPALAARIVAEAARGLHAAHETRDEGGRLLGVVHRDVSPPNIFVLREGSVRVLDFGIARMRGRLAGTGVGEIKGKVAYMAPEQLEEGLVDRRVDVWSLGVVLWEVSTGRRLFRGADFAASLENVVQAEIPLPSRVKDGYPLELEAVVMAALERSRDARIPTAEGLADRLERYLYGTGEPCGAAQVAALMRAWLPLRDEERPAEPAERRTPVAVQVGFDATASLDAPPPPDALGAEAVPEVPAETIPPAKTPPAEPSPAEALPRLAPAAGRSQPRLWLAASLGVVLLLAAAAVTVVVARDDSTVPDAGVERIEVEGENRPSLPSTLPPEPSARGDATADASPAVASDAARSALDAPPPLPPPETTPRPPRREPPGPGSLNLLAIPAATVGWNGRDLGRTPIVERPMPSGRHSLVLRPVGGGEALTITVVIRPGETTRRTVRLR